MNALAKQGDDSWFFLTVDYAFGLAVEQDATQFIKTAGARCWVRCATRSTPRTFSYVLQADLSKAKNLMIANGGGDIINAVKQAAEFGLIKRRAHQRAARPFPTSTASGSRSRRVS